MRSVLAYPGNMAHAQNIALALHETNTLDAFVTSFAWQADGLAASLLSRLPFAPARRLNREMSRRSISMVPRQFINAHPHWEVVRSAAMKLGAGPVVTDMAWDHASHSFDSLVANSYVPRTQAVLSFEYTALASFQRAQQRGVARVLHLPSLDSRQFEEIQRREKSQWPELVGAHDGYFNAKFERRYARRRQEIALADVIIANSSLTARSHISAGADPSKVFAVPLGAPPAIADAYAQPADQTKPLRVIWAGPFSLRKGAHYLLAAWQRLAAGKAAELHIYGQQLLPPRLSADSVNELIFHGSVPQSELFAAYQSADVLVFPTLSDGFGMVVAEALAHGLPVITTNQAGAADLITPDNGLIVEAANARALADSLRWCLDNRLRLAEMRLHAVESARRRQWSNFRSELCTALYRGLTRAGYQPNYGQPN